MNFNILIRKLASISEKDYYLCEGGIEGLFHLGEKNLYGLHLIDATPEEVLSFVKSREYQV